MAASSPLVRTGKTISRVVSTLKEQILDGRLAPGQRLIANDLLQELGVSRGSLREAFRQLDAERLINLTPNKGAIVRKLNIAEVNKLFEIRIALEGFAARMAAEKIDQKGHRKLFTDVMERGRRHQRNPIFSEFIVDNRDFHQAIVTICENDELGKLIDKYQLPVFMLQLRQVMSKEEIIKNGLDEHEAIAAAILASSPDAAYNAMKKHLLHSLQLIIGSLTSEARRPSVGLTMTEKIYAAHSTESHVRAGDIAIIVPDVVLLNDTSGTITAAQLKLMGIKQIANPDQVVVVTDHFYPPKDVTSADSVSMLKNLSCEMGIKHLYDSGRGGIEHALLPEIGMIGPGGLVFCADSHTCTAGALNASGMGFGSTDLAAVLATGELWVKVPPSIRIELTGKPDQFVTGKDIILTIIGRIGCDGALNAALEFGGPGLANLNIDERFAIANMAVEAGAETCVFEFDEQVQAYIDHSGWTQRPPVYPDSDASYQSVINIALESLQPVLAAPPSPDHCKYLTELLGTKVDQVYIGNCSNGTMTDLRQAASILSHHDVKPEVRLVIVPATNKIYRQAGKEGLLDIFARAGAFVSMPTCGACFGGHMGILAAGETAVATTNRNFRGRMGHVDSKVFLANAWVAAAAAVRGEICDPATLIGANPAHIDLEQRNRTRKDPAMTTVLEPRT